MKKKKAIAFIWIFLIPFYISAHNIISGRVVEKAEANSPVPGATIYFPSLNTGTQSDSVGNFTIEVHAELPLTMIVSMMGYKPDTIAITKNEFVSVELERAVELQEVKVGAKREDLLISTIQPINSETLGQGELLKAACCNLSEAFETNPTINVAYKDAVTGAKEIQLLGLSGIYSQLLTENIPNMQGIAGIYGLTYIPGPWMESIQLTKGSGSVVNGYESTTGLINVEFKKPLDKTTPRFYLNLFSDDKAAMEVNSFVKKKFSQKVSTMLLVYGRYMNHEEDFNKDGFMDIPKDKQLNLYNRWQLRLSNKVEMQLGLKYIADKIEGGQTEHIDPTIAGHQHGILYKTNVDTKRAEAYAKIGVVYPSRPQMSIGNILQVVYHDMRSNFGLKTYNANEKSFYYQGIFQNYFVKMQHQYKLGVTFKGSEVDQEYLGSSFALIQNIPGVFLEYTYNYFDKFTFILGGREDYHFDDGWIFIPRLHAKYNFSDNSVVRFSAGGSYRRPYFIADHISILATSRNVVLNEKIKAERAWNYGANFTQKFELNSHQYSVSFDAYHTDFTSQLIMDVYSDSTRINFYNLDGKSYSNSIQVTANGEVFENLELRLAYKFDDVRSTYKGVLLEVPLVTRSRGLFTMSYAIPRRHWKMNYTLVYEGQKTLQFVYVNENSSAGNKSPEFFTMNAQATKEFKKFEVYFGAENILAYRQMNPIVNAADPFGDNFDATNIWGPISGRRIYVGLRFAIK